MSVHGEFGRVLEALRVALRPLDHPRALRWDDALEAARVGQHPDLTAAARAARLVAAEIAADPQAGRLSGLVEPLERLAAHCRIILGEPDP